MINIKSYSVIDEAKLPGNIRIYGAGATGSAVAVKLIRLALANKMIVYDYDEVEEKNLNNQAFLHKHIGMPKVKAIKDIANSIDPGNNLRAINKKVGNVRTKDGDIAIICLDNYEGRADILESPSRWNALNITGGISAIGGNVNIIRGKDNCLAMAEEYREDSGEPEYHEEDLTPCGSPISIYHRIDFCASIMAEAILAHMEGTEPLNKNIMFDIPNLKIIPA